MCYFLFNFICNLYVFICIQLHKLKITLTPETDPQIQLLFYWYTVSTMSDSKHE